MFQALRKNGTGLGRQLGLLKVDTLGTGPEASFMNFLEVVVPQRISVGSYSL
jgi:hypothetical protein